MSFAHASLALVSINVFLLIIAVYWAATSWQQLHHVRNLPAWHLARCHLIESSIAARNQRFRNQFRVDNFTRADWPHAIPPTIAYRYGSPVYNQTLEDASNFQKRFDARQNAPCWVYPFDAALSQPYPNHMSYTISMSPVTNAPTKSQTETATVSSVFAAVTSTFLFILLCAVICLSPDQDTSSRLLHMPNPPSRVIDSLSEAEINLLCKKASFRTSASVDACAICLEDEIKINAQLPCGHCFHRPCITTWLQRGNLKCPLCNLALNRQLLENHPMYNTSPPLSSDSHHHLSVSNSSAQHVHVSSSPVAPQPAARPLLTNLPSNSTSLAAALIRQHTTPPQQTSAT